MSKQLVAKFFRLSNNLLSITIVGISLYIISLPLVPEITFALNSRESEAEFQERVSALTMGAQNSERNSESSPNTNPGAAEGGGGVEVEPLRENTLIIPKIRVFGEVNEGEDESILSQGIWRRPNSSTPDQGSNTVVVAHRFLYTKGPNTFYHLDKIAVGDELSLAWEGEIYNYRVREIKEVEPTAIEVEAPTEEPILTLYTCTPLWTAEKRLVVIAELL